MKLLEIIVNESNNGRRAFEAIAAQSGCSRSFLKQVRLYGSLLCNGLPIRMIAPVKNGDLLLVIPPEERIVLKDCPNIPRLFQNDWVLAVNKPAGYVVHPCLNHELPSLTDALSDSPLHPVNRLDRETTGIVLIALNGHAHFRLSQSQLRKRYLALVHGRFEKSEGIIDAPIKRRDDSLITRVISDDGAWAKTIYRELYFAPEANLSLIEFELLSGRTHQIRVHSLYMGHPLFGDTLYGLSIFAETEKELERVHTEQREGVKFLLQRSNLKRDLEFGRQALHAYSLDFTDPLTDVEISLKAPLPEDMMNELKYCMSDYAQSSLLKSE